MHVVIVGAGHAGASVAIELRKAGFEGEVTLVGDEPYLPYQRPPLSKAWLKGEADQDSLALRPAEWYEKNKVALRLETPVESIDRMSRHVALAGGAYLPFDHLVIATGARARTLPIPGIDLRGICMLRDIKDAIALKYALKPGCRLAIVGGGYVGLEIAASGRALGADVILFEREPRLLARVACPELSTFFTRVHADHGVDIRLGAAVSGFQGKDGVLNGVVVDGAVVACDVAVVGVGALPNQELAQAAGLDCDDGIVVDAGGQTSDEGIYAVGDVTRRQMGRYGRSIRFESVPNALEQAKQVAGRIVGKSELAEDLPWFWSEQYNVKLQIAGMVFDCSDLVCRGDAGAGRFALFHLSGNKVMAVEAINAPAEFMFARSLIAKGIAIDPVKLADPAVPIRDVVLEKIG